MMSRLQPQANKLSNLLTLNALSSNLKRLLMIRVVLLIGTAAAVAYAYINSLMNLQFFALAAVLLILCIINGLSAWRLKRPWPVTEVEFFAQLLVDIASLTLILYFAGGSTNPFVSYYLIPIIIAAATLPRRYTWTVSAVALAGYTLLLYFYYPISSTSTHTEHHSLEGKSLINLHILGMWFNFLMSAILISWFVVRMAAALRKQENHIIDQKEDALRNEQIMAVATLAAGTTHELGTPLSAIGILVDELIDEHQDNKKLLEDLQILKEQTLHCKNTLKRLASTAEQYYEGKVEAESVEDYLNKILDHWLLLRPDIKAEIHIDENSPSMQVRFPPTIEQSVLNLLQNAADASPDSVFVKAHWTPKQLTLTIKDNGPGISTDVASKIGKPFFTTKKKGLGLGLFLTHATINKYGGKIKLFNDKDKGTTTQLTLPLEQLNDLERLNGS